MHQEKLMVTVTITICPAYTGRGDASVVAVNSPPAVCWEGVVTQVLGAMVALPLLKLVPQAPHRTATCENNPKPGGAMKPVRTIEFPPLGLKSKELKVVTSVVLVGDPCVKALFAFQVELMM